MVVLESLDGEQHQVNRSDLRRVVGGLYFDHEFAVGTDQFQPVGPDGFQVLAPGDERHVVAGFDQQSTKASSDAACAHDSYSHNSPEPRLLTT